MLIPMLSPFCPGTGAQDDVSLSAQCCASSAVEQVALLACPHQGSAGRDILLGLFFWCFSVNAFFPAWLPEVAPQPLARQAWLKAQDSKSMVTTARGLYCDTTQHADPSRKPLLSTFVHAGKAGVD